MSAPTDWFPVGEGMKTKKMLSICVFVEYLCSYKKMFLRTGLDGNFMKKTIVQFLAEETL